VDNERGKSLAVCVAGQKYVLSASEAGGHVHDAVTIPAQDEPLRAGPGRWIDVVLEAHDPARPPVGTPVGTQALLLPPEGVSVISDIDDTVKISEVRDRRALLARTFLQPYEAVDGAAERYGAWERAGASLHFVSGSPWQLHEPLAAFLAQAGFPRATLHLREFRWKDRNTLSLLSDPEAAKRPQLEALLAAFPQRRFVLVGDSGEADPEIYGALARAHPGRILLVAIRDVTDQARSDARYAAAFRELPDPLWMIWTQPDQIPALAFESGR
jgi:phosphatidate phosphatase APP1